MAPAGLVGYEEQLSSSSVWTKVVTPVSRTGKARINDSAVLMMYGGLSGDGIGTKVVVGAM
jgi:hypothetical protein